MRVLDPVSALLKEKGDRVWSIAPDASVYDALDLMAEKGIGALLVLNGSKLAGLLSERDYARKVILKGRSSKETRVGEIMATPAVSIGLNCAIDEAMRIMTENRVRHLPVVNASGDVLGIVSIGDIVKWVITSHEATIEQLEGYIAGRN
jgi:CBS domain-containing protein